MRIALRDFSDRATGADIAAVFYAGHGIEIDKQNYLIPVDARLGTDRNVRFEAIPLDDVLVASEGAKGLRIIILDACRENPFATKHESVWRDALDRARACAGRAGGLLGAGGLRAAREGQVADDGEGRNSPLYGRAPGQSSRNPVSRSDSCSAGCARRSSPTPTGPRSRSSTSLSAPSPSILYLPATPSPPAPVAATQPPASTSLTLDQPAQAWAATKDTQSIAVLKAFIERFADTIYGDLAKARLEELERQALAALGPPRAKPQSAGRSAYCCPAPARSAPGETASCGPAGATASPAAISRSAATTRDLFDQLWCDLLQLQPRRQLQWQLQGLWRQAAGADHRSHFSRWMALRLLDRGKEQQAAAAGRSAARSTGERLFSGFDSSRDAWSGSWGYCDDGTNRSWNGKR